MSDDDELISSIPASPHPTIGPEHGQVRDGVREPYRDHSELPKVNVKNLVALLVQVQRHFDSATRHKRSDRAWAALRGGLLLWKHELEDCIRNAHRGPNGIFPDQLRQICCYLGPVDGVSEVLRKESLTETFKALREAGGDAWDKIDDPEEYLERKEPATPRITEATYRKMMAAIEAHLLGKNWDLARNMMKSSLDLARAELGEGEADG